jgi:pimeloyl-ACP methyl ester carboxylesterase
MRQASRSRTGGLALAAVCCVALVASACSGDSNGAGGDGDGGDRNGGDRRDDVEFAEVEVRDDVRPVVFVHGGSGSGAQFQSQALRFASNGYPMDYLQVVDYNSLAIGAIEDEVHARIDDVVAGLQSESGSDQVDLMGHSLGTLVSQNYLRSAPERAADVAHYVNIDGRPSADLPGGVPTLALWGEPAFGNRTETGEVSGGTNVHFDDQSHVQVATSAESFREMFKFFNDGEEPDTLEIVPQRSEDLTIAGRAVHFPQNEGVPEGTLEIYEVDPTTAARLSDDPETTFPLSGEGEWGPFDGSYGASYELVINRGPDSYLHHFYLEPLIRSDHLIRLNTSPEGEGLRGITLDLAQRTDDSPPEVGFVFSRYKEWWGDQGDQSDTLEIDGVNILNAATSPRDNNSIGVFAFDVASDGVAHLEEPIEQLFAVTFLTGVDFVLEGADPPTETVTISSVHRGDTEDPQVVRVRNWVAPDHAISVHFYDFVPGNPTSR